MKKIITTLLTGLLIGSVTIQSTHAATKDIQPTFTYGESLNNNQYAETKRALGVQQGAKEIKVQINELNHILHDNYPYNQVYSSSYITPANNNGKVTVQIVTPQTITTITPLQYENAALTAGATNVNIKVGSAVTVDGSGALAGVYKAFADAGHQLDAKAVQTAQEELEVTGQITTDNKEKAGYTDEALNAAIAEMKTQVQETKQANNNHITADQINIIINQVINNYGLNSYLTQDHINQLSQLLNQFSQIQLSEEQKQAISNFGQEIVNKSANLLNQAKTKWDNTPPEQKEQVTQQANSIWEQIKAFIASLFAMFK